MRWDKWLQGLFAAFVTGASTGFTTIVVEPASFNLSDMNGIKKVGTVVLVSGLMSFFLYLKTHPLPDSDTPSN